MRKVLLLGLMLWGSASAQTWKALTDTTKILYTDRPDARGIAYAQGNTAGLMESVLDIITIGSIGDVAASAYCVAYTNLGMMGGSFVLQIANGLGKSGQIYPELTGLIKAQDDAKATEYVSKGCGPVQLTNRQIVYVPEGKPLAIQQGITLTLKLDANGYAVATIK